MKNYKGMKLEKIVGTKRAKEIKKKVSEGVKNNLPSTAFKKGQTPWNKNKKLGKNPEHSKRMTGRVSANKGNHYKLSEETKRKQSESRKGSKHWNWQDGKSFEPYSREWTRKKKEEIRQRDNHTCQIPECKKKWKKGKEKFCVHHIDYNKKNCKEKNLITLCRNCHLMTNINRKFWIKYFKNIIKQFYVHYEKQFTKLFESNNIR